MKRLLLALFLAALIFQTGYPALAAAAKKNRKAARRRTPAAKPRPDLISQITDEIRGSGVHIENGAALAPFFERLNRKEPVSVLHYGDSHTAADIWTGELRRLFQSRFGDGGAGFSHAGRPWKTYRRENVRSGASKRWHSNGLLAREGDGMYGLGGVSIEAERTNEWVSLEADGPVLQVWYLKRQGGGTLELSDAGQVLDTIGTAGEVGPGYYERDAGPGPHEYKLRITDGLPVRLFGWVTGSGEGLTYEMLGINGSQVSIILGWDEHLLAEHVRRRNPGLIVLAYGTNEASNKAVAVESYRDLLVEVIGRVREVAPGASILVIGPPDRASRQRRKWLAYTPVDRVVAAERAAAAQTGCAFYDLRGKMGGTGVMHHWFLAGLAQADHVHLNGAGYRLIAKALYSDVMLQFDAFLRNREEK